MRFQSTRDPDHKVSLEHALASGTAPDGGLYVPEKLPSFSISDFDQASTWPDIADRLLQPFFKDSCLKGSLHDICIDAFDFPLTVVPVEPGLSILELFHGPTSAFKDVGARFLAASLQRLSDDPPKEHTILVATSGDTGGAVAAAFHQRPGFRVVVLFPDQRVSKRQQHQLTCWGDNVSALAVKGNFDDCQRMVKEAFAKPDCVEKHGLASANSINIGRLLPQMTYYAASSLWHYRETGNKPNFIIPTGNLGNAFSCVMARSTGLPIGSIALATNANRPIPDFLESGVWEPRTTLATLASAMDVGNPSNMERLRNLYPEHPDLSSRVTAQSVDDQRIAKVIGQEFHNNQQVYCPHTATGVAVYRDMSQSKDSGHWIVAATAHPAKFDDVVEPVTGPVEIPHSLTELLSRPSHFELVTADVGELIGHLEQLGG